MILVGVGEPYFSTGTKGISWALCETNKRGYDSLHILEKGDELTVYSKENRDEILWKGIVDLEYEPLAGMWIHGPQHNINPETWAMFFIEGNPMTLKKAADPGK